MRGVTTCGATCRLVVIVVLLVGGCSSKVIYPEVSTHAEMVTSQYFSPESKVAISVTCGYGKSDIVESLRDSLSEYGVADVIESDVYHQDRININVYVMSVVGSDETKYTVVPLSLISAATYFLIPIYDRSKTPVEIHVVDERLARSEQVKIVQTHYTVRQIVWLPLMAVSGLDGAETHYGRNLSYEGMRRVFDNTLSQLTDKYSKQD